MLSSAKSSPLASRLHHRHAPAPIHFPVEATVPETKRHLKLRTLLFQILETFAHTASIGCDQFVYWSASNPKRCLAPDAFVRLGTPDTAFTSWKTWERGAPELAVEIVSDSDAPDRVWEDKLADYHDLGVNELLRFDPDAPDGEQLRVWDRIDGNLVERTVEGSVTPSPSLEGLFWVVCPAEGFPAALRLARDAAGAELVPTAPEARTLAETEARKRAERRVAELEEELRKRGG